jgi:aconitate hydratase
VAFVGEDGRRTVAYCDSLVGTDSHTTMINGLGVLGWGVGGIEAEAAMLGQPVSMLIPEVVGFKLTASSPPAHRHGPRAHVHRDAARRRWSASSWSTTAPASQSLSLADRATIANMAPEYGATMGFFPVDAETLKYLRLSGRSEQQVALVEAYCKAQGLFRTDETPDPVFTDTLELDLSTVVPSMAGPKRPQDRIPLDGAKAAYRKDARGGEGARGGGRERRQGAGLARRGDDRGGRGGHARGDRRDCTHGGESFQLGTARW